MNSKVSIIIPSFNREKLLTETLSSIKNQTHTHWECLIIDDHSTDLSVQVINGFVREDARFQCFIRPDDKLKGANSCRNFGLEKASGEYVMFFDSDDLLKENCLENRLSEFAKNPNYDFLVFSMGIFDHERKPQIYEKRKVVNLSIQETINEFVFSQTLPWNVCRPLFRTSFIQGKIAFNEKIHNFQDNDFNMRVLFHLKPNYLSIDYTDCYYRFDWESVNKYSNPKGYQNQIDSLYEYYKTVFLVLDDDSKKSNRNQLINSLFTQIKSYVQPYSRIDPVNQTVQLFKKEINLSFTELTALQLIKKLNKIFLNRKGYHFLSKKIKDVLLKN